MPEETQTAEKKDEKPAKAEPKVSANGTPTMRVKIYAPFKTYYDQDAESVTAENVTGEFDILPRHKNFMTLLSPCQITVRNGDKLDYKIKITRAIMHIKADEVKVFLDV